MKKKKIIGRITIIQNALDQEVRLLRDYMETNGHALTFESKQKIYDSINQKIGGIEHLQYLKEEIREGFQ